MRTYASVHVHVCDYYLGWIIPSRLLTSLMAVQRKGLLFLVPGISHMAFTLETDPRIQLRVSSPNFFFIISPCCEDFVDCT